MITRAYYSQTIAGIVNEDPERILGLLVRQHAFALEELQRNAWMAQIGILKQQLHTRQDGYLLLEYSIPRMGKRVDTVLLIQGVVFVVEFKIGEAHHTAYALDQALDYALDLKNFHEQSHHRLIVPIVVATQANPVENPLRAFEDGIFAPLRANRHDLNQVIAKVTAAVSEPDLDPIAWRDSAYRPTPTIIEAAQALYQGHRVIEIARSDAGAINLSLTAQGIADVIEAAKANYHKAICFVTGVPGAGKTLAGLNIANERLSIDRNENAVFLSGNGPLVTVLREALARDDYRRSPAGGQRQTKKAALSKAQAFIQNIHHFRDEALADERPPHERVAIFDEAQRAWTREQTAAFMKRKRNVPEFSMSEPEFLISIMDRHPDWAVIVCLVGGGQEINTGEAGLLEWLEAIRARYPHWRVYCSPNLNDAEYLGGTAVTAYLAPDQLGIDPRLHLAVSIRSYRAESVSAFVKAVLDNDRDRAETLCREIGPRYPIVLTRDINQARAWLRAKARGTERLGLLASSGAIRLRPLGLNVQADIDVVNWFLGDKDDVRSSYYLEEAATEFDVQGLELDWAGVVWDADLRYVHGEWAYHAFQGTKWRHVHDAGRRRYLKNAYRVLLTRARQGMIIVVPEGDHHDQTRQPEYYDGTFRFLKDIGLAII